MIRSSNMNRNMRSYLHAGYGFVGVALRYTTGVDWRVKGYLGGFARCEEKRLNPLERDFRNFMRSH